jgi:hypothetical protein
LRQYVFNYLPQKGEDPVTKFYLFLFDRLLDKKNYYGRPPFIAPATTASLTGRFPRGQFFRRSPKRIGLIILTG